MVMVHWNLIVLGEETTPKNECSDFKDDISEMLYYAWEKLPIKGCLSQTFGKTNYFTRDTYTV